MARPKTSIYAAGITCLGFICFILAAAAVGIPIWGHYDSPSGGYYDSDRGYFSLFKVCKQLTYNREKCGSDVSKFQLASSVYVSGLLAILSTVALGIYCILAIIQMAMISSREKVVMKYTSLVLFKMFMALIGCLLAIIATILFAVQIDDSENYGFRVTRGISFYIQIAVIGLTIALFVASVYDMLFSRKPDGDPTMAIDTSPANATTFNNPGFKEGRTRNDHCGALPYMSEIVGYMGPIYMTHPTKAIAPILLEDMRKVAVERKGESNFFTTQMIKDCMKKVTAVTLHQSVMVDYELEIKAYYAGHVLGAAMFWIRVGSQSVVYTGDYNMTPDRHLGAAWIDKCRPDLLITESTYATTIRDSKRCRERDFLKKVHECVARGGKVLIPVFALGRAQELCILLETYWERMNLKYPIYFALGLTEKANTYYKMFITWTNQKIRKTFVHRNMFEFKHIKPFDKGYIDNPGAMVVFATPGMLHAGLSLQIFKKWAPNENNMVIMPGYCVQGTIGHKVLAGQKKIEFENRQIVEVKMSVEYMSFSAHADAKGIMQLIQNCEPKNVMLVHGEAERMQFLCAKIKEEFKIDCFMPANGETCIINTPVKIPVDASLSLLKAETKVYNAQPPDPKRRRLVHGVLVMKDNKILLMNLTEGLKEQSISRHVMKFTSKVKMEDAGPKIRTAEKLFAMLQEQLTDWTVTFQENCIITVESVDVKIDENEADQSQKIISVSWTNQDEDLGSYVLQVLQNMD